ncbi:hypothetical protein NPX13_g9998 [Xylaria arbuscula]|uniref:Uncharacterized protein n=1 Tax=Xylaria arbuscula TaxID=114810 RepID=A0A9W8N5M0_9PEZI|nr:hypothetical protein NPX13_g9998 [Xylaria arbuscula]
MPARNNPPPQIRQIYVHPYSTYHYRFPVVVHSANGHRLTASPIFYTAIVPESATVRDIEAELINRQGQVGMARLMATENLVCMNTFQCIRTLHDAALQLEVWDVADVALIP